MFNKLKKLYNSFSISNKLIIYFLAIFCIFAFLLYNVIPIILNYPPDTINTQFDKEVSVLYYKYQFLLVFLGIGLSFIIYFKVSMRKIDKWWKNGTSNKQTILYIRKKAMNFPYRLYLFMEIFPTLLVFLILSLTGSHPAILFFKMGSIIFSFSTLVASIYLIFSKNILYPVLVETSKYTYKEQLSKPLSLKSKLIFQLFPGVLVVALIVSLVGYYRLTLEKAELLNDYYSSSLRTEIVDIATNLDISYVESVLSPYYLSSDVFSFIEEPDGTIITSNNTQLSDFFIKYMHDLSPSHDNTVYEAYTVDSQAVILKINTPYGPYTIGIYYEISSFMGFLIFLSTSFILFIFNIFITYYIVNSLTKDIKNISDGLQHIINNDSIDENSKLPITSNDELGQVVMELNEIQDLTQRQVSEIKDSQDKLMEKERLASLGQLIGGIAHNLKTPIMSISGAAEGLNDLIREYDTSIGDPEVNENDHHDIAKDMSEWVKKIRDYTEYMSDVITAVKGQAVVMSEQDTYTFTIDELVKRVDILMKHELKNALINLKTSVNTDGNIELTGNVNSLVQVINNMISNAIQAYNGKTNENIEFIISKENSDVVISIRDYAGGLPKEVADKLFKEMITTKGKNGTGLGLFMSYSNIRAHFNGNITVDSKPGVGTQFNIILPV